MTLFREGQPITEGARNAVIIIELVIAGALFWVGFKFVDFMRDDLPREWNNSSGAHDWTELPKRKRLHVLGRVTVAGQPTMLVLAPCLPGGGLWYVLFENVLPDEVRNGRQIIILDDPKNELLLNDHEQGVIVLTTSSLCGSSKVSSGTATGELAAKLA